MAFKIRDLMIDVLPAGDDLPDGRPCHRDSFRPSECHDPSCADCKPHSHCAPPSRLQPEPEGTYAASLPLLREQLRQTLARQI
ncbi:MAG TPA: hypothetical protein VEL74_08530 [Thermoanaerobaculia bacterium]|nr:hypothetical protein [Thermoanaerobaculia bacterium]